MTPAEIVVAKALGRCSFLPGCWDKRFSRDMAFLAEHSPERELSDRQGAHLLRLCHKYRRQIPAEVIEAALDEMERNADRRVAAGLPALPDFSRGRATAAKRTVPASLPLLDWGEG